MPCRMDLTLSGVAGASALSSDGAVVYEVTVDTGAQPALEDTAVSVSLLRWTATRSTARAVLVCAVRGLPDTRGDGIDSGAQQICIQL